MASRTALSMNGRMPQWVGMEGGGQGGALTAVSGISPGSDTTRGHARRGRSAPLRCARHGGHRG